MVEAYLDPPKEEGQEEQWVDPDAPVPDPHIKVTDVNKIKVKFILDQLRSDAHYKARFFDLVDRKVVKLQSMIKALYYFLEYNKDDICVEGSQLLFWKKARNLWNDELIRKMEQYNFEGAKDTPVLSYQKVNFVEACLREYSLDDINQYNYALGLIYRWMKQAIESRKKDIIHRLSITKIKREERFQKEEEAKQRADDRESALGDALSSRRWLEECEVVSGTLSRKLHGCVFLYPAGVDLDELSSPRGK